MKRLLPQPIAITLQPSKVLLGLLSTISIVACVILAQLPISILLKCCTIALVLFSSAYYAMRDAMLGLQKSWRSLEVSAHGVLKLSNNRGEIIEPILATTSLIHGSMTILNFKGWRLPPLILFTSQTNQEELRKLRVWLRWWRHIQSQADDLSDA